MLGWLSLFSFLKLRGRSLTMLTKFGPLLTTYLPPVDICKETPSLLLKGKSTVYISSTTYSPRIANVVKERPPKSWAGVAGWISKCEITLKMQSLHCWHRHGLRPKWFIKSWTSKEPAHSCARPSLNYCYYIELPNTVVENLSHLCRFRLSYFLLLSVCTITRF